MLPRNIGTFIDYSVVNAGGNKTKTYWYIVVPVLAGKVVNWSASAKDILLEVPLHPKNNALVHRWIANKEMCELIQREPDRENNYKCLYNGLSSIKDPNDNKYYYDFEGHLITSRWGLGLNISKGSVCSDNAGDSYKTQTQYSGMGGFDGEVNGDCIGTRADPTNHIEAKVNSIFCGNIDCERLQ